ncbi:hypothetical protein [Rhizosphaericola mali]|uniref:PBCV-specific basic adaptor domain-containing protein n=1 Tax=Rhizosphaericola mali TaxID=2545455 RepID=A0A5P2FZT1_9BACT|nr:hypothetical protein [Rhizosphaericola mali]QES89044.1 hypothetical protein E0W69_010365 [Rhizosphaericola mali]
MKKILSALMALVLFTSVTFAQSATKTAAKAKTKVTAAADTAKHYKKDGTLDKRFNSSKASPTTTAKHLKKDGTLDKRFKENKSK